MVVRLYAFFSEQTVRMATTPNRSAVRNALAKLVQAHMNLENTARAKNNLKRAINNHLSATINRNKAINHVLKSQGYKYSNANRANILTKVNINNSDNRLKMNLKRLVNSYNINKNKTIQRRSGLANLRRKPKSNVAHINIGSKKKPPASQNAAQPAAPAPAAATTTTGV
jgi:hypothetical protein